MANRVLAEGFRFPEGPAIDREGNLYVVEIGAGRVSRIAPDGSVSIFAETGGGPNGSAFGPDGYLYVCNNGGRWPAAPSTDGRASAPGSHRPGSIQRISPEGKVETFLAGVDGVPFAQPNDLCFDPHGGFYFTVPVWPDSPEDFLARTFVGDVCYATLDGHARRVHRGLGYPNGVGVTPDGETLVVACSFTGKLVAFPIRSPGVVGEPRDYASLGERSVPDGFCFDVEGRVLCAGAYTQAVHVFPPGGGEKEAEIPIEGLHPTNACFGGPDFRTLYITESGSGRVVATEWRCPGHRLFPDR